MGLDLADIDESHHKPAAEASSHPPGTVVAPMAGLVVKVLVLEAIYKNGGLYSFFWKL